MSDSYLEVRVEVWEQDADEPVELVEVQLEHWQLGVEKLGHVESVDHVAHHREGKGFVPEKEVQESSDEVHALAVV